MIAGIFAMTAFNLTDAYFVSRLGTEELAAMSFTFPVVMVIGSIAMGLGLGVSSCVARAIGSGDEGRVRGLATDSLILTVLVIGLFAAAGLLTLRPLFTALGASGRVLELVERYMGIWYSCIAVVILPMVGNNAIRATGDTLTPSVIMMVSAGLNVILDPIMIFGLLGFPRLGFTGAVVATVSSRAISLAWALYVMHTKCRLIDLRHLSFSRMLSSWKSVLHIGIPTALTNILMPLSNGVITRMVAAFGTGAVAGFGAGTRVARLAYMVPIAMGSILVPFIGQNYGAGLHDRARRAWKYSNIFGVFYGVVCLLVALPLARPVGRVFSSEAEVSGTIAWYLWIIMAGSGLLHVSVHSGFALNALARPFVAATFNGIRLLVFLVPLAWLGSRLMGVKGIFGGMSLAYVLAGLLALVWVGRYFVPDAPSDLEESAVVEAAE